MLGVRHRTRDRGGGTTQALAVAGTLAAVAAFWWRLTRSTVHARRPLVVPLDDSAGSVTAAGHSHPSIPQLAEGRLVIPVENVGSGAAVGIYGQVLPDEGRSSSAARSIPGLGAGRSSALVFGHLEQLAPFQLDLSYGDSGGHSWTTSARWTGIETGYVDVRG